MPRRRSRRCWRFGRCRRIRTVSTPWRCRSAPMCPSAGSARPRTCRVSAKSSHRRPNCRNVAWCSPTLTGRFRHRPCSRLGRANSQIRIRLSRPREPPGDSPMRWHPGGTTFTPRRRASCPKSTSLSIVLPKTRHACWRACRAAGRVVSHSMPTGGQPTGPPSALPRKSRTGGCGGVVCQRGGALAPIYGAGNSILPRDGPSSIR